MERPPEYNTWIRMRRRCNSPKSKDWPYYGGRGIKVCERWNSYDNFIADMGPKPNPELTLERVDNNRGYSPDNCVWATRRQQSLNRRKYHTGYHKPKHIGPMSKTLNIWRIPLTVSEMCKIVGIRKVTYYRRISKGMTPVDALLTPKRTDNERKK